MSGFEPVSDEGRGTAALRRALGCFVTGVTVVTAREVDGGPHGFTANSFTSVSLDPPLVLVCVGRDVERLDVYRRCSCFAINVLGDSQRAISVRFATQRPDRFAGVRWREGTYGLPIIDGCIASLQCESWRRIEAGDHMILIGRVLACEDSAARPLAYWRGRYRSLSLDGDGLEHENGPPTAPVPRDPGRS